jgi:hypothetical protein
VFIGVHSWFEKTKPICDGINQHNILSKRNLWRIIWFWAAEKQTQSKPIIRPSAGNPKHEALNPKQDKQDGNDSAEE